tara:strand:+ start:389 stop:625 length:237 start_codon:yes stop_codon:yes gene_type:complete
MAMDYDQYDVEIFGITPETKSYSKFFVLDETQVARLEGLYDRYFGFDLYDRVGDRKDRLDDVRDELDDYLNEVGVFFY